MDFDLPAAAGANVLLVMNDFVTSAHRDTSIVQLFGLRPRGEDFFARGFEGTADLKGEGGLALWALPCLFLLVRLWTSGNLASVSNWFSQKAR